MVAPLAVMVVLFPSQRVAEPGVTDTPGIGLTVTLAVVIPLHPLVVPVRV